MYFIAILAVIITFIFTLGSIGGMTSIGNYLDPASLLLLLIICIPLLIAAGATKDFINAFRLVISKKEPQSIREIKRAIHAVELTIRSLWYGSLLNAALAAIFVLSKCNADEIAMMWRSLGVSIIVVGYGLGMIILLLPVKTKLEFKLIEWMHDEEQG